MKLDGALVYDIDVNPAREALAAGMAHFANEAGITLVAEGVETAAGRKTLLGLGITAGQG